MVIEPPPHPPSCSPRPVGRRTLAGRAHPTADVSKEARAYPWGPTRGYTPTISRPIPVCITLFASVFGSVVFLILCRDPHDVCDTTYPSKGVRPQRFNSFDYRFTAFHMALFCKTTRNCCFIAFHMALYCPLLCHLQIFEYLWQGTPPRLRPIHYERPLLALHVRRQHYLVLQFFVEKVRGRTCWHRLHVRRLKNQCECLNE